MPYESARPSGSVLLGSSGASAAANATLTSEDLTRIEEAIPRGSVAGGRYYEEQIGDKISLNGISGTVESIGHTMTTVRGPNGSVYLVPNSHFLTHVVEKQEPASEASEER